MVPWAMQNWLSKEDLEEEFRDFKHVMKIQNPDPNFLEQTLCVDLKLPHPHLPHRISCSLFISPDNGRVATICYDDSP